MTSSQKGLWFFMGLVVVLVIYKIYTSFFNIVDIQGISPKKSSLSLNSSPDSAFQCQLTTINSADSLTLLNNLGLKPYFVSNILKYRKKIKLFFQENDLRKVYGIEKVFSRIQNCINYELPSLPKISINTADSLELSHFLPNYLASRIYKYREKKGGFRNWQEIQKIYGLDSTHFILLQHFCFLEAVENSNSRNSTVKEKVYEKWNLNLADSLKLEKLPKIGPKIASRIIKFRNLLPYFIDFQQLSEIYGMNDTILDILKKNCYLEKPINFKPFKINDLDYQELSKHPYIGKQNAKLIINFRNMHGKFHSWEDLKKVKEVNLKNENYLKEYFYID